MKKALALCILLVSFFGGYHGYTVHSQPDAVAGSTGATEIFSFLPFQDHTSAISWDEYDVLVGDLNGDGYTDLIWNETVQERNRTYIGLSDGGTFTFLDPIEHPWGGWAQYDILAGDVNGDGCTDLIWNETSSTHNRVYVGLAACDGTFTFLYFQDHPGGIGWANYNVLVGDVDGNGYMDLIWNEVSVTHNRTFIGLANGDGTFAFPSFQDHPDSGGWASYDVLTGDVNGDGYADLIWNETSATGNRTSVGLAVGDGTFTFLGAQDHPSGGDWAGYIVLTGDVNGDGYADLIWNETSATGNRTSVGLAAGDGTFTFPSAQDHPDGGNWAGYRVLTGDVNGDGYADLIWNETGATGNRTSVGLAVGDGTFTFPSAQDHPDGGPWDAYDVLVGDVNGDGHADLVWNETTSERNRIYVGLAYYSGAPIVVISGATTGWAGQPYTFLSAVIPNTVTIPITYTWEVTEHPQVIHTGGLTDTATFTWNSGGTKTISVTADSVVGLASASHVIDLDVSPVHLPLIARDYYHCYDFFDDFSDPTSGWPVGEDAYVRYEYLGGEYRVLSKKSGYFYLFRAPTCDRQNYIVETDARWQGKLGNGYGLIFGITEGFEHYYLFDVNTSYQMFRLYRRDPSGFTEIVAPQVSTAILSGTATNHIKVTRNNNTITLNVNGTALGTWSDNGILGLTGVGVVASSHKDDPRDARFDDFRVTGLPSSDGAVRGPSTKTLEPGSVPDVHREPAFISVGW